MLEFTELLKASELSLVILDCSKRLRLFDNYCLDLTGSFDIIHAFYLMKEHCNIISMQYGSKDINNLAKIYNVEYIQFIRQLDLSSICLTKQEIIYLAVDSFTDFDALKDDIEYIVAMQPIILKSNIKLPKVFNIGYTSIKSINNWEILKIKKNL